MNNTFLNWERDHGFVGKKMHINNRPRLPLFGFVMGTECELQIFGIQIILRVL